MKANLTKLWELTYGIAQNCLQRLSSNSSVLVPVLLLPRHGWCSDFSLWLSASISLESLYLSVSSLGGNCFPVCLPVSYGSNKSCWIFFSACRVFLSFHLLGWQGSDLKLFTCGTYNRMFLICFSIFLYVCMWSYPGLIQFAGISPCFVIGNLDLAS